MNKTSDIESVESRSFWLESVTRLLPTAPAGVGASGSSSGEGSIIVLRSTRNWPELC